MTQGLILFLSKHGKMILLFRPSTHMMWLCASFLFQTITHPAH